MNLLESILNEKKSYTIKVFKDNIIDDLKDYQKIFRGIKNKQEFIKEANSLKSDISEIIAEINKYDVE